MPTLPNPDSGSRHDRWPETLFDQPNGQKDELAQSARDEQCESAATALFDGPNLLIRRSPRASTYVQDCPESLEGPTSESTAVHARPAQSAGNGSQLGSHVNA